MSSRSNLLVVALLALLSVSGCTGANRAPSWVNGADPDEFPEKSYVTAIGTGETLAAAQTAAKAELSRVFVAEVDSELQLVDEEIVAQGRVTANSMLRDDTRITSALELEGVTVPRQWRDPGTGEIWALAVIERRGECLRIRSEGADLLTELDDLVRVSRGDPNPLLAIRASISAVGLGTALDALEGRSRVLGSQCLPSRSVSTGALRSEATERLRRLSFIVRADDIDPNSGRSNGPLPQLREQIAGNLSRLGFQVGPADGAQIVAVTAHLRLSRVARGTDWVEYRYEGSASLESPTAGDPAMIVVETEGAESHPEPSTARLRARRSGEKALADQLDERLIAFLRELDEDA